MFTELDPLWVLLAFTIFLVGMIRRGRLWMMGKKDEVSFEGAGRRIKDFIVHAIAHGRMLKEPYPGLMHLFIFCACVIPFLVVVVAQIAFSAPALFANLFSFFLDVLGTLGIAGILLAAYRRYIQRPDRLSNTRPEDAVALIWVFAIIVFGFCVEGLRLQITEAPGQWAPAGFIFSKFFSPIDPEKQVLLHKVFWRIHFFLVLALIACVPFTKFLHTVTSALNIFIQKYGPAGVIKPILDFETAETFGVSKLEEFTRKQLFDLDACTRCGRCQDACPAYLSEKPLSPKNLIQDLKAHMEGKGVAKEGKKNGAKRALVGDVIMDETLWACTMCLNCHFQCPVFITSVDKIIEMRRYLVLMESNFPVEVQAVFKNMENNSNPWGVGRHLKADWARDLDVRTVAQQSDFDIILYPGCAGAFDDRYKKVSKAIVKILQHAGIKFSILGAEEGCCGDSARRIGNEYLYESLVQYNIGTFKKYGVKKILTICPHCYNSLKNEYPQHGGNFEVLHHSEFVLELLNREKLRLNRLSDPMKVCYHDSCFLGRYNGVYDEPRKILNAIDGISLVEMDKNREKSFCCGAGGGRMWMEEHLGRRINEMRIDQAAEKNPDAIITACPYCLTMLEDGLKAKNKNELIKSMDIAEVVLSAISA